jgi:hypothetical protein
MPPIPEHVNNRLPDNAAIAETLTADPTVPGEVTVAQVDEAITTLDVEQVYTDEDAAWTVEVWDRTSTVNGVPAEDVLSHRDDIPKTGDVVLIRDSNGNVVQFQPHEPAQEGFAAIPKGKGKVRGGEMAEDIVTSRVAEQVLDHVATKIREDREGV